MADMSSHSIVSSISQPSIDNFRLLVLIEYSIILVDVTKDKPISSIFDLLKGRNHRVDEYLKRSNPYQCRYLQFERPVPKDDFTLFPSTLRVTNRAAILEAHAAEVVPPFVAIGEIFPDQARPGFVHLRIERSDDETEEQLKQVDESLFNCLTIGIASGGKWRPSDISLNFAHIRNSPLNMPTDVTEVVARLRAPRQYTSTINGRADSARLQLCRSMLKGEFGDYFISQEDSAAGNSAPIESNREFEYFASATTFAEELALDSGTRAENLKPAVMMGYTMPPGVAHTRQGFAEYEMGNQWPLNIFVKIAGDNQTLKYQPKNDFSFVSTQSKALFVIGEVVSDSNRWGMLCQAIALARFGNLLLEKSARTFVVMAVYITKGFIVERYFVYQPKKDDLNVEIIHKSYSLRISGEGRQFLREMYNYGNEMHRFEQEFDRSKLDTLDELLEIGKRLGSWSNGRSANLASSEERTLGADASEVFYRPDVQHAMVKLGLRADPYILLDHPFVATLFESTGEYYVKFLRPHKEGEFQILSFLSTFVSPHNPILRGIVFRAVDDGILTLLPNGGNTVYTHENLSQDLLPIARQLFEGVAFLHEKEVTHNDLKPSNILVDKTTGRLSIIDFHLANRVVQFDGRFIGTKGWTAPEVGSFQLYNPVLADVWAAGNVVLALCKKCPEATPHREFLLDLCRKLMSFDPKERSSMKDAVERIKSYIEDINT